MSLVVTGLIAVSLLCLLNLLLLFGVIRRLRQYNELLPGQRLITSVDPTVPVGSSPEPFAWTTTAGELLSQESIRVAGGQTLVGFFSPDCSHCEAAMDEFVAKTPGFSDQVQRVLAVVMGEEEKTAPLASRLESVADVMAEPSRGPVGTAFAVNGVPAMCLLDADGVVVATGRRLDDVVVPVSA